MNFCVVFLFAFYLAGTFASPISTKVGIYDGKTTTIESFPYIVAIFGNGSFLCAGTIVSESWVVTTANCINNTVNVSSVLVTAGTNDTTGGLSYGVNQTIQHPDYDSETYDYEYSLVQIQGTFNWSASVKAALLPTSNPCPFSQVTAVGFGATSSSSSDKSGQLMKATMAWWPRTFCKSAFYTSSITMTDRMACGFNADKTTLCSGDLADPFVKNGVLYGLFTNSISTLSCSSAASYVVSPILLADVLPVADWISSITQATFEKE